ncbi:MAG: hypothetical protein UY11_C0051G0004 [Candidatus Amesbacteria bacterium GW2011_GWC2_47_8]|uniref:Nitroreductase n=1 Tax=Candidatus Amesbacteria bacterium GW2011_GWC2_47_8 TaxID=1618367 RepID=A0A0G1TKD6_9BACT|nr:MAG: hypothetical protein UY11_C0051G0004 [Candidatus Amesbacteria bacterium GW2011_GWC2_47_8]
MTAERRPFGLVVDRLFRKFGANYDAWRLPVLTNDEYKDLSTEERLFYLVSLAHLAGSSHNTQPWAFHLDISERRIEVFLDRERVLSASDVEGRQACVSVGWAIGNLAMGAMKYGSGVGVDIAETQNRKVRPGGVDKAVRYIRLGAVGMEGEGNENDGLCGVIEAMVMRRIERRQYDTTRDFTLGFYKKVESLFDGEEGTGLRLWRRGDSRIKVLAELQLQADGFVANSESFSRELVTWFVENETQQPLGMPGSTFNLTIEQAQEVIQGLSGRVMMKADNLAGFALTGKRGIESAACVGMLTVKRQDVQSWVRVGMRLGAIANLVELEQGGLAVHAGLAEVALVRMSLAAIGMTIQQPVVLFRAGLRKAGEERMPHSPRLPIEEVII